MKNSTPIYQLVYYAHSKRIYNTDIEFQEYQYLKQNIFGHIICPNTHLGELGSIEPYLAIVKKVDMVVLSEYKGYVGRGVYKEAETALEQGIPVLLIKKGGKNGYSLKKVKNVIPNDIHDWVNKFGKLIV